MLDQAARDLLFDAARTHNAWADKPVDMALIERAWSMARMGPTSANCSPLRLVLVRSPEAKARLEPLMMEGNRAKTAAAPVTAILAHDMAFHEHLPRLFPHADAKSWFAGNDALIAETAFRNGTLQAAYFLIALRAVGLDCGPMSGFEKAGVDAEFLADSGWRSNFVMNIGYGDPSGLFPRSPRFDFQDVARVV